MKLLITLWSPERLTAPPGSSVLLERSNGGVREWAGKPWGKSGVILSRDFVARVVLLILSSKRDSSVKVLSVGFSSSYQFTRMLSHLWILWQRQHLYSSLGSDRESNLGLPLKGVVQNQWTKRDILLIACSIEGAYLLVKSVWETALKFIFWAPTCVPGFEYAPWLAC